MSNDPPRRRRKEGPIERPGPAVIPKWGGSPEARRRFRAQLDS